MTAPVRALIAEDEPVLARTLQRLLGDVWPELQLLPVAEDGIAATELALRQLPDVLFLDIRMPGPSGLAVAAQVADEWPEGRAVPLLVFVTAHDEFAVQAFEHAAVDYVLKPVTPERLARCAARLREALAVRAAAPGTDERAALVERVQGLAPAAPGPRIKVIRAGVGNTVRMIAVTDVLCFEATDKYVNVVTAGGEALVRMSLRELMTRIDATDFIQVHRNTMVNGSRIESATRDDVGHYHLKLQGLARPIKVSRAFGHLFRPM
ncbi:MAG TPA: LytTR family DNA-binding domain-containing protein [Caldimonas sp.]|jgi:DNA-binding LytR/AlgR family response regulator|nr:LytTR family DNA-binding domain-containing protein [Caldimonas sp.]HEX2541423.1 LytTR family DNA-binding domain-containing protein [Caldimonas sp.]